MLVAHHLLGTKVTRFEALVKMQELYHLLQLQLKISKGTTQVPMPNNRMSGYKCVPGTSASTSVKVMKTNVKQNAVIYLR